MRPTTWRPAIEGIGDHDRWNCAVDVIGPSSGIGLETAGLVVVPKCRQ